MKKRILSSLLALAMVLSLAPFSLAADATGEKGTESNPYTTVDEYNTAIANNGKNGKDVYLTIDGEEFSSTNLFNLTNVQSRQDPPKLHLTLTNCTFTGNTANDNTNSSFMYLPNCQSLVIESCDFDTGEETLQYGINWNLCTIQGATVRIEDCTFDGTYGKNAVKLNQRNGEDDMATDVKPEGWKEGEAVTAASIADAQIINCTFESDSAVLALGSKGKGTDGAASPSTGAFPVTISGTEVSVLLDYQAEETATVQTIEVAADETASKTADGDFGTEDDFVAEINGEKYVSLPYAVSQAGEGDTITLLKDVTLDATGVENTTGGAVLVIDKGLTINGNENTISGANFTTSQGNLSLINILNGADVTLDNVIIDGAKSGSDADEVGPRHGLNIWEAGTVTLNDVTVQNNRWYGVVSNGSDLVINGLTTTGNAWGVNVDGDSTVTVNDANIGETSSIVYENTGSAGSLAVNNGTFQNLVVKAENSGDTNTGTIRLTGGTFNGVTTEGEGETNVGGDDSIITITGGTYTQTEAGSSDGTTYVAIDGLLAEGSDLDDNGTVVPAGGSVASINGQGFNTLQEAIDAANDGDTIVLLDNVTLTGETTDSQYLITIPSNKNLTIQSAEGQKYTITATYTGGVESGSRSDHPVLEVGENSQLTLSNVKLDFSGTEADDKIGDGIRLGKNSALILNNGTEVTLDNFYRGFIFIADSSDLTTTADVTVDGATLTVSNITANGSNGGDWTIQNNSTVNFNTIGNHGLSVETLTVDNSTVTVNGAGYSGIVAADLTLANGATVNVTNSGNQLPLDSTYAPDGESYKNAVEIKADGSLDVSNSTLSLTGNVDKNNQAINTVYVGEVQDPASDVSITNSTFNGELVYKTDDSTPAPLTVYFKDSANGVIYTTSVVTGTADGDNMKYTITPAANPTGNAGQTFTGWAYGGQTYPLGQEIELTLPKTTTSVTFTAVWTSTGGNPGGPSTPGDTYTITVPTPVNGTVTVSPSGSAQAGATVTVTVQPNAGYTLGTLSIRDSQNNPVTYTSLGNNRYSFTMPESNVTVLAVFTQASLPFTDVASTNWYYEAVRYVWENELMQGTSATTFGPNVTTTRSMVVTILWRLEGEPTVDYTLNYNDVAANVWYTEAVRWATANGIVLGYDGGFHPSDSITREQMAAILYRYADYKGYDLTANGDLSSFTDGSQVSSWAQTNLEWAVGKGLLVGGTANQVDPQGSATRAQVAQILMRFCETIVR